MAPLKITAKLKQDDNLALDDLDDSETVEALAVIIYSLRPELGEELRIVHKGRLLKDEGQSLAEAGIKTGDVIAVAVAKKPAAAAAPAPAAAAATAEEPAQAAAGAPEGGSRPEPAATAAPTVAVAEEPAQAAASAPTANLDDVTAVVTPGGADAQATNDAATPAAVSAPAAGEDGNANAEAKEEVEICENPPAEAAQPEGADAEATSSVPAPPQPGEEDPLAGFDVNSAAAFRALADRVESGAVELSPAKVAEALRGAATRMMVLEGAVNELGQALKMVHIVTAQTLQNHIAEASGSSGLIRQQSGEQQQSSESPKSYLVKRGDADIQEEYKRREAAAMNRQTSGGGGTCGGGALNAGQSPMSKEEMQKGREARLAALEKQAAEKKRQQEEADEKAKSREAMFNRPFAGAQKTLGKMG